MTLGTPELHAVLPGAGLAQDCSTLTGLLITCAEGNKAQGYLCHFLVPICGCPPAREVTEVKKKKKKFLQTSCGDAPTSAPASAPHFLSTSVQLLPCAPAHSLQSPCPPPRVLCGALLLPGSFLASVMDVANDSWGLSILSSCTRFNSMFLHQPLI